MYHTVEIKYEIKKKKKKYSIGLQLYCACITYEVKSSNPLEFSYDK